MVQRTIVLDDLDDKPGAVTHTIALDGETREVDLHDANWQGLQRAIAPFWDVARKVKGSNGAKRTFSRPPAPVPAPKLSNGNGSKPAPAQKATAAPSDADRRAKTAAIREWAKGKGIEISDRGRIPAGIEAQYDATQTGAVALTAPTKRAVRAKVTPSHGELLDAFAQVGSYEGVAEVFGLSTRRAKSLVLAAQEAAAQVG